MYFIVSLRAYVCDHVRASVSGLLRPFLSCGFYPLKSSFIEGIPDVGKFYATREQRAVFALSTEFLFLHMHDIDGKSECGVQK